MGKIQFTDFNWHRRAQDCIAQGALTNSKRPETFVKGVYPTHVKSGYGCYITDLTGKRYIDFICGLGTNLLGYANVEVCVEIVKSIAQGLTLSLSTDQEIYFAEKVKELFPFVDCMKILKTGTEACMAAVRIARAATGRQKVFSEGYHGWSDEFVALSPPALGVNKLSQISILDSLDQIDRQAAAVIVEPVISDNSTARMQWLRALRDKCNETGALLIFDEVITGLRYLKHGVSNCHNIEPDLICLGKAIGGGMPLSLVAGKKHIMNCGEYFVSSTFAGERASLSAGIETMRLLQTKYHIDELWIYGQKFQDQFNGLHPDIRIEGYPTRGVFRGEELVRALFFQEACRANLLFGPSFFFNFCHIEHVDAVINTCGDILRRIQTGSVELEGEMPQSPFAQKQRG